MNKNVTVGIPFYKNTKKNHLGKAIESIINQTFAPKEIHLIQDGPINDKLYNLIKYYKEKYNNIKHLEVKKNRGLSHALNISILNTSTKYYARMDSDDISDSKRIEKQMNYFEEHPELDVLGTWGIEFEDEDDIENGFLKEMPVNKRNIKKFFHYRTPFIHSSVIFEKDVFAKVGLYNTKILPEDIELWARILKEDLNVANLAEPLLYFRTEGMINRRTEFKRILGQARGRYKYNTLSPKYNILKISSLLFRFLPEKIQKWSYNNLR